MTGKVDVFSKERLDDLSRLMDYFQKDEYPIANWLENAELRVSDAAVLGYPSRLFKVFEAWKDHTDRGTRRFIYSEVPNTDVFAESVASLARLPRGITLPHPLIVFNQQVNLEVVRSPRGRIGIQFRFPDSGAETQYRSVLERLTVA